MTTFDEYDHPRSTSGRFTHKDHAEADLTLAPSPVETHAEELAASAQVLKTRGYTNVKVLEDGTLQATAPGWQGGQLQAIPAEDGQWDGFAPYRVPAEGKTIGRHRHRAPTAVEAIRAAHLSKAVSSALCTELLRGIKKNRRVKVKVAGINDVRVQMNEPAGERTVTAVVLDPLDQATTRVLFARRGFDDDGIPVSTLTQDGVELDETTCRRTWGTTPAELAGGMDRAAHQGLRAVTPEAFTLTAMHKEMRARTFHAAAQARYTLSGSNFYARTVAGVKIPEPAQVISSDHDGFSASITVVGETGTMHRKFQGEHVEEFPTGYREAETTALEAHVAARMEDYRRLNQMERKILR